MAKYEPERKSLRQCSNEIFLPHIKKEHVEGANYGKPQQARLDIFKYIETYCNTKRIHSSLSWLSPLQLSSSAV
ncbi:IS3 family transposase [Hydrogenoanaerobacterium saccharovorans]|uniref:IS3 family transposase n=1 Tax=Hydrogenoanaerobacterium saccharovorans TaxID=474960 RepID=UPI0013BE9B5B